MRKDFVQILKEGKVDIKREYNRLYQLFYARDPNDYHSTSVYDDINNSFSDVWFRGTALNLDDFDEEYGFNFEINPENLNIDILVDFCEYFYNFVQCSLGYDATFYTTHILKVIDKIGYKTVFVEGLVKFVENDPVAISVAEILPNDVSYRALMYNHHSLKGNIEAKKEILLKLADLLEPKDKCLNQINSQFKSDLFNAFNNLNLRHNNVDPKDKGHYRKYVDEMKKSELEKWYDEVYQMCLLAFLLLEHAERKPKFDELMKNVNAK